MATNFSLQDPRNFLSFGQEAAPPSPLADGNLSMMADPNMEQKLPMTKMPTGKGKQSKADVKEVKDLKNSVTKNLYDTGGLASRLGEIGETDLIKDQRSQIDKAEKMLSMREGAPTSQDAWVKPLLAFVDAQHPGSNLAGNYQPGETQSQRQASIASGRDDLQKRKEALAKLIFEGAKASKEGTETNQQNQQLMQSLGFISGQIGQGRYGDPEERMAFQAHQGTLRALRADKPLKDRMAQYQNLDNALAIVAKADHITPQQFDETQQAIRSNLGIKGTGGVEERDRTRLSSLGFNVDRISQLLSAKPADIGKNAPLLQHVLQLARLEQENIKKQANDQLAFVSGGNEWMYDDPRYSKYKKSLDSMLGVGQKRFTSSVNDADLKAKPKGGKVAAAPTAKAYPEGEPNAQWSGEQVAAFLKDHGG